MLPWLSSGVIRCAIVLTFGWLALAAIVAATSRTLSREEPAAALRPGNIIKLEQRDPGTYDLLALDSRLVFTPAARVDESINVIHTILLATRNGRMQSDPQRLEQRVSVVESFSFTRTLTVGLLDPFEPHLRLVERPNQLNTVLRVQLQPFWNGSNQTVTVTDSHLACE
jgi:hypothetical protein